MSSQSKKNTIGINGSFLRKPATGIGQVSWHFLQNLIENNHKKKDNFVNKYIIYVEEKPGEEFWSGELPKNVKIKIVQGWYKRDDLIRKILWEKFWLPKQIKKDGCDKFLSLYQSTTILSKQIKHTMFVHDTVPKIFPEYLNNSRKKLYYWLVDRAIKKVQQIMTISKYSRQEISRFYNIPKKDIKVNYIACDPIFQEQLSDKGREKGLKKYGLKLADKFILYEGGLDARKNISRIIKAYGKLAFEFRSLASEKYKEVNIPQLVIVGKFNKHLVPLVTDIEEETKKIKNKYNLPRDLFKNVGFVEQEDLPALFQSAEVFIYPSLYEGFGMPVLEAMNSGIPVVTSNTTSIPEVISKDAGYLIENPKNTAEIKEKLKEALLDSSENKQQKIALAKEEAQKFSWQKFVAGVLENI